MLRNWLVVREDFLQNVASPKKAKNKDDEEILVAGNSGDELAESSAVTKKTQKRIYKTYSP